MDVSEKINYIHNGHNYYTAIKFRVPFEIAKGNVALVDLPILQ